MSYPLTLFAIHQHIEALRRHFNLGHKQPAILIAPVKEWEFPNLIEVWRAKDLIWMMLSSTLRARYRQSALSALYLFIQPLISVGIFTFIFSSIAKIETGGIPYPLFGFIGVTTWNFFNRSLNDGNASLVSMSPILSKVYMPRLVVVFVSMGVQLFEYLIGFSLVFLFFAAYGVIPSWRIIFCPLVLMALAMFSISLVLWLSNLNVQFRDISILLPGILQVLFYATPVVYPLSMVPEKWHWLYLLNPMTSIIEGMRFCLIDGYPPPFPTAVLMNLLTIVFLIIPGLFIFHRYSKTLVDRV